ncbi:MAG: hypothetical protein IH629_07970 [Thermoleophilia bacterium]|nr:hypothetical protein [Thermoleophilia bacterium]
MYNKITKTYYRHAVDYLYALDEMKRQTLAAKAMFEKDFGLSESDLEIGCNNGDLSQGGREKS